MAAAFIFYGLANPKFAKKWLLWISSAALVLSIPIVGSRTIMFTLVAIVGCVGIAALFGVSQFVKSLQIILAMVFISLLIAQLPIFSEATATLFERLTQSSAAEGTVGQSFLLRIVDPITGTLDDSISRNDLLGSGMGYGAGAVAQLLTGSQNFLAGEGEFERVIYEFGWPWGLAFMLSRWLLAVVILVKAIGRAREHEPLAWLLSPLTLIIVGLGTLEQPTEQGFFVICIGFSLASLKESTAPERLLPLWPPSNQRLFFKERARLAGPATVDPNQRS
jgi:hypothetical protein